MSFEKLGKGEALVWLSGAAGLKAVTFLAALLFSWAYVIPEVNFAPSRLFYSAVVILALVFSYLVYRVGVAGEKPRQTVSLWFSGFFGIDAVTHLVLLVMGWTLVVTDATRVAAEPIIVWDWGVQLVSFVVSAVIAIALWKKAKKSASTPAHRTTKLAAKPAAKTRKKRR